MPIKMLIDRQTCIPLPIPGAIQRQVSVLSHKGNHQAIPRQDQRVIQWAIHDLVVRGDSHGDSTGHSILCNLQGDSIGYSQVPGLPIELPCMVSPLNYLLNYPVLDLLSK